MSGPVLALLAGAGLFLAGLLVFLLRAAQLRFEVYFDRPQGEPAVLRFQVWLPPLLHLKLQRTPMPGPPAEKAGGDREGVNWARILSQGWETVQEMQVVQHTVSSLLHHDLAFLNAGGRLRRRVRWVVNLLQRVPWWVEELSWVTRFGAGDPALTGVLSGLLWTFKGTLFGVLAQRMALTEKPVIRILPDFEGLAFRTTFRCIVRVRLGDIIAAGAGFRRRKRGARWRTNTRLKA